MTEFKKLVFSKRGVWFGIILPTIASAPFIGVLLVIGMVVNMFGTPPSITTAWVNSQIEVYSYPVANNSDYCDSVNNNSLQQAKCHETFSRLRDWRQSQEYAGILIELTQMTEDGNELGFFERRKARSLLGELSSGGSSHEDGIRFVDVSLAFFASMYSIIAIIFATFWLIGLNKIDEWWGNDVTSASYKPISILKGFAMSVVILILLPGGIIGVFMPYLV